MAAICDFPPKAAFQQPTPLQSCEGGDTLVGMLRRSLLIFLCLALQPAIISAQRVGTVAVPPTQQLRGLNAGEASALVAKLSEAQIKLRAGEFQSFELISGSIAGYDMVKVSPRDAFLQVSFQQVWQIERVPTDNRLWQPFKLAYAPDGLGQLYWDIEVVLGASGQLERVTMIYKPPAPF